MRVRRSRPWFLFTWVQIAALLPFLVPPATFGEWRCEDGIVCTDCTSAGSSTRCDNHCAGGTELRAADCRDCCHFVAADMPGVQKAQPVLSQVEGLPVTAR